MQYENVLLIGGPRDGGWITVMEGVREVRLGQLPKPPACRRTEGQLATVDYVDLEYRRVPVQSSQGFKSAVFVFGNIDPMAALIAGYRRP